MTEPAQIGDAPVPSCPACGHTVFNKRYPNCEFCGVALPEGLVLSPSERKIAFEEDRKESDANWLARQKREKENLGKRVIDGYTYLGISGQGADGDDGGGSS
jgi:hypothetical protein